MTVTVEVNATWRLSRVEFSLLTGFASTLFGQGEVLLQEAPNPAPEADLLKRKSGGTTYGTMPSDAISRTIDAALLAETVDVEGVAIDLKTVMAALQLFFERWRMEDAAKPPITPTLPPTM